MSKRRLLLVLVILAVACIAAVVTFFVMTQRSYLAPFAGVATEVAVVCAMLPVWMQHK
jgi:capsular polysaccharide biosynthesis protein